MLKQFLDRVWTGGTSPHDSEIYALIHKELSSGAMDPGLWTKAIAASDGTSEKAKYRYIEMRANVLRGERKQFLEFAKQAQRQKLTLEKQCAEQERRTVELQSLKSREELVQNQLWTRFKSPDAKKKRRKRQITITLFYLAVSTIIYYLIPHKGVAVPIIIFGFLFWLAIIAAYGKSGLEKELGDIRRRINSLGGNA